MMHWGYLIAALMLLLSMQAAPALAFASRLARGDWGVPVRRAADLFAVLGVVTGPGTILVLQQLPEARGRPSIWLDWPGAPGLWDSIGIISLLGVGIALIGVTTWADRIRPGWRATQRQWQVETTATRALGGLYVLVFVFVQLLVSSDLAMSLVPGWASANFPAYHAVSSFELGVAATVLVIALVRRRPGLSKRIPLQTFQACAKLLLALALLWFYFTWSEFLTYWYGRTPAEQGLLALLMFGPGLPAFAISAALCCVVPVAVLIWGPVRRSIRSVTIVAGLVVVGCTADRLRIYLAAWSPGLTAPELLDIILVAGVVLAGLLVYLLALWRVPAISLWEERESAHR
jgi:hypothetical protein